MSGDAFGCQAAPDAAYQYYMSHDTPNPIAQIPNHQQQAK
jgi:hypothetical protein